LVTGEVEAARLLQVEQKSLEMRVCGFHGFSRDDDTCAATLSHRTRVFVLVVDLAGRCRGRP
jgi:hypothetical protein